MKYFSNLLLQIGLSCLSYIFKKANIIVLGANRGYGFRGNTKALFIYFNKIKKDKEKNYQYVWITKDEKIFKLLSQKKLPVVYAYSIKGFLTVLKAKKLFVEVSSKDVSYIGTFLNGNFSIVNTWHGAGFKQSDTLKHEKGRGTFLNKIFYRIFLYFLKKDHEKTIFTASSQTIKKEYEDFFPGARVFITGFPRNDIFFKKSRHFFFFNYRKKLGLNQYKKVFLYAPTFRDFSEKAVPFSKGFLEKLDKFLVQENYILLIKKHSMDKKIEIGNKHSNIKDVSSAILDVQDLLPHIDVLISDYSSIVTDFSLSNRPILFYLYDYKKYQTKNRRLYFDVLKTTPGPFIYKEDKLINYLKDQGWFLKSTYQKKFKTFKKKFHYYHDGNSIKRIIKLLGDKIV